MPALRRLTPEDVLGFECLDDAQISPDGELVAFTVGDSFKTDTRWPKSQIWVVPTAGGDPRQLTSGPRTDCLPRWSPDGSRLAFLSDRLEPGQRQVFLLPRAGGEALPLTDIKGAIPTPRSLSALQWSPDGRSLAFLLEDPESDEERRRKEAKDDAVEFEQNPRYVRLWIVDVATREVRCVSPDALQIWEFAWSPDSRGFAAVVSDQPYEWSWYTNRLVRFDAGGPARTLWHAKRQVSGPCWAPDGKQLAFLSSNWSDRGVIAGDIWLIDAVAQGAVDQGAAGQGAEARQLTAGEIASFGWIEWPAAGGGNELLTIAHERGGIGFSRIDAQTGKRTPLSWRQAGVSGPQWPQFSLSSDGVWAVALEDFDHPRDIEIGREEAGQLQWRRLTHFHPQTADFELGATEPLYWKGADDWQMQGLVIKPVGYEPGKRYPLVTWVHGGPVSASGSRYYAAFGVSQLLAAEGYAVFLPNYRGSVGWGLAFAESNLGDMGGQDFTDIQLGIDALIENGLADRDRLAISGWSYGGFMSAWAVSQTDRFRAAVMGAGIAHWQSFHGKSCLTAWDAIHYETDPYEPRGTFEKFSPLAYAKNIKTPTLILHGEKDEDVPVEQAHLFFRALKDLGVPTVLIVYPREPHGVSERAHMLDLSRRVIDWMKRYL